MIDYCEGCGDIANVRLTNVSDEGCLYLCGDCRTLYRPDLTY